MRREASGERLLGPFWTYGGGVGAVRRGRLGGLRRFRNGRKRHRCRRRWCRPMRAVVEVPG